MLDFASILLRTRETSHCLHLRIHWRLSTILKTSSESLWSSAFWYVKVYIYSESSFNTLYIEIKTQMLKKVTSYKKCKTLQKILFFSFASSNSSQFFNSQSLNELQHKFHLSERVWDFKLRFCLVFVKKLIFLFNKKH